MIHSRENRSPENVAQAQVEEKYPPQGLKDVFVRYLLFRFIRLRLQIQNRIQYWGIKEPVSPQLYASGSGIYGYKEHPKPARFEEQYFWQVPLMSEFYEFLASLSIGSEVLDLGSGVGAESEFLQRKLPHLQVRSLDLSNEGVLWGKSLGLSQVQGRATALPFQSETFSAIHSKDLLVHIKDKKTFLEEVQRVLQENGLFCLVSADAGITEVSTQFSWNIELLTMMAGEIGLQLVGIEDIILPQEDWYPQLEMPRWALVFQKVSS